MSGETGRVATPCEQDCRHVQISRARCDDCGEYVPDDLRAKRLLHALGLSASTSTSEGSGMEQCAANTPEIQKLDRHKRRREARRHWLRCQWGRTGYRPTMRLLHRMNLCWMEPSALRDGENGQWINVWCHWCGVRGKRLDMARAMGPR